MGGYVESPSTGEVAALAKKKRVPFVEDLGSGAMVATEKWAAIEHEPTPAEVLRDRVVRASRPERFLVELDVFLGRTSEDHRAEAPVADGERVSPLGGGLPVPERRWRRERGWSARGRSARDWSAHGRELRPKRTVRAHEHARQQRDARTTGREDDERAHEEPRESDRHNVHQCADGFKGDFDRRYWRAAPSFRLYRMTLAWCPAGSRSSA